MERGDRAANIKLDEAPMHDVIVVGGGSAADAAIERGAGPACCCWKRTKLGDPPPGPSARSRPPVRHTSGGGIVSPADNRADMPGFAGDLDARQRRAAPRAVHHIPRLPVAAGFGRASGPMPEPPHRQPRMHNVLPNSLFIYHLERRAAPVWRSAAACA